MRTSIALLLPLAALAAVPAGDAHAEPSFHGSWGISLSMSSSYSSGPDRRTDDRAEAALRARGPITHDYPRPVRFAVFEMTALVDHELVSLSPSADWSDEERSGLPFAERRDVGVGLLWLDTPWPPGEERETEFDVPSRAAAFLQIQSAFRNDVEVEVMILPHYVGHGIEDAVPLLSDAVMRERDREMLAAKVSHALGRRYRYLTDTGDWSMPDGVPEILPPAPWSTQLSAGDPAPSGDAEKGARLVLANRAATARSVQVAGDGEIRWITVEPGDEAVVDLGLESPSILEVMAGGGRTDAWSIALLERTPKWPDEPDLDLADEPSLERLFIALNSRYVTRTLRIRRGNRYLLEIGRP